MSKSRWNRNLLALAVTLAASAGSIACGQTPASDYEQSSIATVSTASEEMLFDTKLLSAGPSCVDVGIAPGQPNPAQPGNGDTFAQPPQTPFDQPNTVGNLPAG